jgi:hypothetical protein
LHCAPEGRESRRRHEDAPPDRIWRTRCNSTRFIMNALQKVLLSIPFASALACGGSPTANSAPEMGEAFDSWHLHGRDV